MQEDDLFILQLPNIAGEKVRLIDPLYPALMKPIISGNETVIYAVLHLFGLCNALTNPILYGYLNENFRKEYKSIYR